MPHAKSKNPTIFILFGATGDLAVKKIFPALRTLDAEEDFPKGSRVIAVSRRDWNDLHFATFLKESNGGDYEEAFLNKVSYSKVDIETDNGYGELALSIQALKKQIPHADLVIYLSLAPHNHSSVIKALFNERILVKGDSKLLIEKPFGTDEKTARELDRLLLSKIGEDQIFRIDHYLGKDTLQAIMNLHESTPDFDNLMSKESVAEIRVKLFETKGIDGRGASYDGVGAFRDVGQNHMLEMLAVVAAELRDEDGNEYSWQKARAKVFTHLAPPEKTCQFSRRGQYEGYASEKGVKLKSQTETGFEIRTNLSSGKLKGVPLIFESGKKMPVSEASVEIVFNEIAGLPHRMYFSVQPDQKILIEYRDGTKNEFEIPKTDDAYANVIRAALNGSTREFVGSDEIEALWSYADHIVECWNKVPLETYSKERPFLIK